MFAPNQIERLRALLDESRVAKRKKQGQSLSYLEGFDVIGAANEIFGFDGWGYVVTRLEQVGTIWYATVRVSVNAGGDLVEREDVGVGLPAAKAGETPSPDAVETAIKSSLTDALKRALRTFGAQFGNELYDKDAPPAQPQQPQPRPTPPRAVNAETGEITEQPALLSRDRAAKLAALIHGAIIKQGADDSYADAWIKAQLGKIGKQYLTEIDSASGALLLSAAAQADVTQSLPAPRQAVR